MSLPEEFVIAPPSRFVSVNWRELWRYRDLFLVFAWREISVRYKQTLLGVLWAIIQPLVTIVLFTFIFNKVAKIGSGDEKMPYEVFVGIGVLLWQYFSGTLTNASNSMVTNAQIVQKVYFPRLIIPASSIVVGLVDLAFASVIVVGIMFYYHFCPHVMGVLLLPLVLVVAVMTSLGIGLFLASLNIKYRDVRYALPFVIQIMMYITPVMYPVSLLDKYPIAKDLMLYLNPMSGVITCARAGMNGTMEWSLLGISALTAFLYFLFGLYYFRGTERYFADII